MNTSLQDQVRALGLPSCSKVPHPSKRQARLELKRLKGTDRWLNERLAIYCCKVCGVWHVGHRRAGILETA